jgi:hypothetical protein
MRGVVTFTDPDIPDRTGRVDLIPGYVGVTPKGEKTEWFPIGTVARLVMWNED